MNTESSAQLCASLPVPTDLAMDGPAPVDAVSPETVTTEVDAPEECTPEADAADESELADGVFDAVPEVLQEALVGRGFTDLTSVQSAVLTDEATGRDLQISSQTGSGKTVALGFVLAQSLADSLAEVTGDDRKPRGPEALIIVPTRELAAQVSKELSWLFRDLAATRVVSVTGGTPVFRDKQMLSSTPRVLVGTPGRLLDHVTSGAVDLSDVRELVLDEADQMLDMGFREELEGILDKTGEERRTHMVSATFPEDARRLAKRYQKTPFKIQGTRPGEAHEDIHHEGHIVRHFERHSALVHLLLHAEGERTLVFVERRTDALELAERLQAEGFAALPLSGELVQAQRDRTMRKFRSGEASVLVATDVAARGLDVPDVAMVIHSTPPINAEIYTHRSGRTGRAGKSGKSVLLAPPKMRRKLGHILADAGIDLRWIPIPSPAEVEAELAAREQVALEAEIDAVLERGPSELNLGRAQALLDGRDAAAVVAVLLGRGASARRTPAPSSPIHSGSNGSSSTHVQRDQRDGPRQYGRSDRPDRGGYQQRSDRQDRGGYQGRNDRQERGGYQGRNDRQERGGYQGRTDRPERGGYQGRNDRQERGGYQGRNDRQERGGSQQRTDRPDRGGYQGRNDRQGRGGSQQRTDRPDRGGYQGRPDRGGFQGRSDRGRSPAGGFDGGKSVRFFINFGNKQGATPSRVLATICRRGEVNGASVGSIAIHPNASTFDVNERVAQQFENMAGRRDSRDPNVIIRKDRGPVHK